jgi:hypothetical protein
MLLARHYMAFGFQRYQTDSMFPPFHLFYSICSVYIETNEVMGEGQAYQKLLFQGGVNSLPS